MRTLLIVFVFCVSCSAFSESRLSKTHTITMAMDSIFRRCGLDHRNFTNSKSAVAKPCKIRDDYYKGCILFATNCYEWLTTYLQSSDTLKSGEPYKSGNTTFQQYRGVKYDIEFIVGKQSDGTTSFHWFCYRCRLEKLGHLLPDLPDKSKDLTENHLKPDKNWQWIPCANEDAHVFCRISLFYDGRNLGNRTKYLKMYPDPEGNMPNHGFFITGYNADYEDGSTSLDARVSQITSSGISIDVSYASNRSKKTEYAIEEFLFPLVPDYQETKNRLRVETHWEVVNSSLIPGGDNNREIPSSQNQ